MVLIALLFALAVPQIAEADKFCEEFARRIEEAYEKAQERRRTAEEKLAEADKWRRAYETAQCEQLLSLNVALHECAEIFGRWWKAEREANTAARSSLGHANEVLTVMDALERRRCFEEDGPGAGSASPAPPTEVPQEPGFSALPPPQEQPFKIPELADADGTDAWEIVLELSGDLQYHQPGRKQSTSTGQHESYRLRIDDEGTLVSAVQYGGGHAVACKSGSASLLGDRFKVSFKGEIAPGYYREVEIAAVFKRDQIGKSRYPVEVQSAIWKSFQPIETGGPSVHTVTGVFKEHRPDAKAEMSRVKMTPAQANGTEVCGSTP